jgi:hypothetical protein
MREKEVAMCDHEECIALAAYCSLATLSVWIGALDIWAAYCGVRPRPTLLGFTAERVGDATIIRPDVRGWNHLTFKSRE